MATRKQLVGTILRNQHTVNRAIFPIGPMRAGSTDQGCLTRDGWKLTPSRLGVLLAVIGQQKRNGTGPTVKELAESLMMTSSAVTQTVDSLVEAGLLQRTRADSDRRIIRVSMTAETEKRVAAFQRSFVELYEPLFSGLSKEELVEFSRLTQKLADAAILRQQGHHHD